MSSRASGTLALETLRDQSSDHYGMGPRLLLCSGQRDNAGKVSQLSADPGHRLGDGCMGLGRSEQLRDGAI